MISVIIRTRNEERWIRACLEGILRQKIDHPVEIILVDNVSSDKTLDRARAICPNLQIHRVDEFRPGFALNEGIRASSGEHLVCLSAHCPPVDEHWLAALLRNFSDPSVAGVYGRQVPTSYTSAVDKRDLLLTFGSERRVQERETFFHNANSMLRRDVWERFPFDEEISNIEDRLWGKQVLQAGFKIVYEPDAAVFHHHGIHQDNRPDRAQNVVRILEEHLPDLSPGRYGGPFDPHAQEIAAIIPLRGGAGSIDFDQKLVQRTLDAAKESRFLNRIFVATDSDAIAKMARELGAEVPFLRPSELSAADVRVPAVLQNFVTGIEAEGYFPDVIVTLEITYPFRPQGIVDGVILRLLANGFDTVVAGVSEYRTCWKREEDGYRALTKIEASRSEREPLHLSIPGLASATFPQYLREGNRAGGRVGIFEVHDPLAGVEIRTPAELAAIKSRFSI